MDRRRAAGALLALAACIACSTAAPTASNQTALELLEGPAEGCYYNFQHYGEGDRIMTNEPCLNCTCHNRMLMCYLRVCPFTKPIGQDCTIEKRADQCCPIVTCPDVPVDLLTSTSTSSPAEYGATGLGKVDKYGCSINGKYFSEGSKVPPAPNKPCEHCYCIRNMTTCVMQECTLHVDGCTPIYHKDVCCPVRYSCDHQEDEMLLLDDMTTTVRPTPGFLLTTTTMPAVTQLSQDCVHDDQIFADGALIKTEKACEHCYCMKGDIVCVVQECGTPMENEGKNCTSLPPRQGQCCPDTYICEGDELTTEVTTDKILEDMTTLSPPRKTEGSGYRNEPDEPYTDLPIFEGSGEEQATTLDTSGIFTSHKQTTELIDEIYTPTEESLKPSLSTIEPDKGQNTVPDVLEDSTSDSHLPAKTTQSEELITGTQPTITDEKQETDLTISKTTTSDYHAPTEVDISKEDELIMTTKSAPDTYTDGIKITTVNAEVEKETTAFDSIEKLTTPRIVEPSTSEYSTLHEQQDKATTPQLSSVEETLATTSVPKDDSDYEHGTKQTQEQDTSLTPEDTGSAVTITTSRTESFETTSINPVENEIHEDVTPMLPPGRIPGEGDCLLNGITYKNNTNVPNINNCHSSCKCVSSIVKCDPIICSPPPEHMENMSDCQPIYDTPDACCPTYVCHSRETIPPESHNQMSGTESPKPLPEKPECHGEDCKSKETASKYPETEEEVKDCKDGACIGQAESSSEASVPSDHPAICTGDSCLPSKESCTDGKCEQPTTSEHICNNENGCQPIEAEPCEGNNCGAGTEISIPKDETPICEDPEGCKVSDTPEVSKPACEGIECTLINEEGQTECTEENCKRKEQAPEEHKPPTECSGSDCITQETTDAILKDESSKQSTTETIEQGYSTLPELDEAHKATETEGQQTEKQDVSPEFSTEKYEVMTEYEHATEKEESYTTKLHITEAEEAVTEQYKEPEIEDHEIYTTKYEEHATESFEQTVKEMSTDKPAVELPKDEKDVSTAQEVTETSPTVSSESSSEITHVEPHDVDKEDTTVIDKVEEFTEKLQTPTEPSIEIVTEEKETETGQEYTIKQEIVTEKPEMFTTHLVETISDTEKEQPIETISQDNERTESDQEVTQPSAPVSHEMATESYVKEDDTVGLLTTQQSIPLEQSSESGKTKVEEMVTDKTYDHPHIVTEIVQSETTEYEPHVTEKEPQTTHSLIDSEDKETETTKPSSKDEEERDSTYKTISDVENTTPKGTQEYVTSSINLETLATESITEGEVEIQHPVTEKDKTYLPETPMEESTDKSEGIDLNESSTQYPEKAVTGLQDSTTKTLDEGTISSATTETLEEHSYSPAHDLNEVSTKIPETLPEEETTQKESSVVDTGVEEITSSPIAKETDSGSTKYSESDDGLHYSPETTSRPEIIPTKYDESITSEDEIEKVTLQPLATRREGIEIGTTESLKQPDEETTEIPDKTKIITESTIPEETKDEMTEPSLIPTSEDHTYPEETHDDKENIPAFVDENKTAETPLLSSTETYEGEHPEHHVTTDFDIKGTYPDEKIQTPTEYPGSGETQTQRTKAPEIVTQPQETGTKSTDLQTEEEIFTQSSHASKEEEKQTESPMSLVTEKGEHITLRPIETGSDSEIDKTTPTPHVTISEPHETKPEKTYTDDTMKETAVHEKEPEKPYTESSEKDYGSETTSPVYTEKEALPETSPTASAPEYTTAKILDIHDEEKTSSPIIDEKLVPTTEFVPVPTKSESEISVADVSDESSTGLPQSGTSKETFDRKELETTTKTQEVSPTTTGTFDHESETIPHEQPIEEHATKKIEDDFESTTVSKITEPLEDHTRVTIGDKHPEYHTKVTGPTEQQDKYTTIPELFTTKYPESFDHEQDTIIPEHVTTKHEDTVIPHEYMTTEGPIYVHPSETDSTAVHDYEKPTEVPQSHDTEKDEALPTDQDGTTLKEASMLPEAPSTTAGILTTESSKTTFIDDSHRRTLSPDETIEPELITEGPKIPSMEQVTTAQPEIIRTPEVDHPVAEVQEASTIIPEKEASHEHAPEEHVTPISHVTEAEMIQTPSHVDVPVITETIDVTTKRTYTELEDNENLQTELPVTVTEQTKIPESTSVHGDVRIPVEVPSDETVPQESETESYVPKVTESEVIEVTKTPIHEITYAETPEETKTPVQEVTEAEATEVTKAPIQEVTEAEAPEVTKSPIHEVTDAEAPEVTKAPLHEVTDAEIPEETKAPVHEFTEAEVPEITKAPVYEVTDAEAPEVTKAPVHEVTEADAHDVTKASVHEVTESEASEVTKAPVHEITDTEAPEETKAPVYESTEAEAPEVTKSPVHELTESEASEVTEVPAHEITDAEGPEETKAPVYDSTEAETPEVTKAPLREFTDAEIAEETIAPIYESTEAEAPEVTKAPIDKVTEAEAPAATKAPVHEVTGDEIPVETEAPVHEPTKAEAPEVTTAPIQEVTEAEAPEVTKSPIHEDTEAEAPEVTKAPLREITEAEIPDESKAPVYESTEAEAPEVTKAPEDDVTEAEAPEVPKAPVHEITDAEAPEETKGPVYESTEAEASEMTKSPVHEVTKAEAPEVTKAPISEVTEAEAPEVTKAPIPEVTEAEAPEETKAPVYESTDAEAPEETKGPVYESTEAEAPEVTKTPVHGVTEAEAPEVTKAPVHEVTEAEAPEVTEVHVHDHEPEVTEITVPKVTELPVPEVTEVALPDRTEASVSEGTEASVPKITEASVPEVSDTSLPKETETINIPESSTYQPKDEKSELPPESSPTSESTYASETTEYLVELQEHKFDQDTSSVAPVDKYTTRSPEVYQTERGDQPLDTETDKSTQEDVQEQYTTKEPFIEKDKLPTPSQEQPSEYPTKPSVDGEIHTETEFTTEKVSISSESVPVPTVSSESQGSTVSPTETVPFSEHEKHTTVDTTTDKKYAVSETEKVPVPTEQTTDLEDELIPTITKATTAKIVEETTTPLPLHDDKIKPEEKPVESHQTTAPELPKPGVTEMQPTDEIPSPDFPQGGTSGYGQEPDYVEEDQAFGPGTCRYGGKVYVSAQQIPRDDPCDFCFCFRSDIICLQQSCPPPIHGCHEEPIQGFCCPRYECPVSMATTLNVTTTTTTTTTTLPPHFFPHAYKGAAQRRGCQIKGHTYKVGEVVRASSGPCLHCTCGGDGQMKCDPKACTPEPMLRQMIAAAVSAKRRR